MAAKEVVDRGLALWRARDVDGFANLYTADAPLAAPGMDARGPDGARMFITLWYEAFPDNEVAIETEVIAGSVVMQEGTFSGTHTGNLQLPDGQVIPPTGRAVKAPYAEAFVVEGDQITSDHLYFDRMELLTQLGLVPEPAAAS
jgi:predicted ester cyclase